MMQPAAASSQRLKIEFAQSSDPGRDPNKQVNEDSCGYAETKFGHLLVLCDGMGGHYGGKEASRTAITTIFEVFEQTPATVTPGAALKAAIEEAGRRVYRLGGPPENRTRPGSTCVAMLLHDRGVDVAHVGDSRAYVIRANQIYPLTRDHSMVQGMIDAGMLTEETALGHPDANKITRALGMKPEVDVEVRPEPMELFAGDVLLQSSDGLTDLALSGDILGATRQALASGPVAHACSMLVQMANDRGGHDNITVQMARIMEVGPRPLTTIPQGPQALSAPVPAGRTPAPGGAYAAAGQGGAPSAAAQGASMARWAPAQPTSNDMTPMPASSQLQPGYRGGGGAPAYPPPAQGPGPTLPDQARPGGAASPWGGGMHPGGQPPPGQPGNLAQYRLESGAGALPLPPPSGRSYGGFGPAPSGPPGAMGAGMSGPYSSTPARPAKGGIVFVIIGLSAVIAVLILILLWALVLR
jgi:PPM family protein phosphatase